MGELYSTRSFALLSFIRSWPHIILFRTTFQVLFLIMTNIVQWSKQSFAACPFCLELFWIKAKPAALIYQNISNSSFLDLLWLVSGSGGGQFRWGQAGGGFNSGWGQEGAWWKDKRINSFSSCFFSGRPWFFSFYLSSSFLRFASPNNLRLSLLPNIGAGHGHLYISADMKMWLRRRYDDFLMVLIPIHRALCYMRSNEMKKGKWVTEM